MAQQAPKSDDVLYYNIKMLTHDGIEYRETSSEPDKVKERIEEILEKLTNKTVII